MENNDENNDYYYTSGEKVSDMLVGLGITIGYIFASVIFVAMLPTLLNFWWIFLLVYVSGIGFFFRKKRRYISIGMIATIVIPLLLIGGCLTLTGSFG